MLAGQALTPAARSYPGLRHEHLDGTVLATIINRRVEDVTGLPSVSVPAAGAGTPPRSLYRALTADGGRHFILECKQSSPSRGDFCRDFDLDRLLTGYNRYAAAISVLCEPHFFKGSLQHLSYVKARTALPVLCKDFIICAAQLEAARAAGADAVLLMLSVLTPAAYRQLAERAAALGLEVLTEVSDEDEAELARRCGCAIVGLNNRDLHTLRVDLNTARRLAPGFPPETALVSESGITAHEQLRALLPIRNFLIGSALCAAPDLPYRLQTLLYGCHKICGLTTPEAVRAAVAARACFGGLIFCPGSVRRVDAARARELIAAAAGGLRFIGVFRDAAPDLMVAAVQDLGLDGLQLHGSETPAELAALRDRLPHCRLFKALTADAARAAETWFAAGADLLVLDSPVPGSGRSFDWDTVPATLDRQRCLLSGGIGPHNIEAALAAGFAGVDVNSRLESRPGIKDPAAIRALFAVINRN